MKTTAIAFAAFAAVVSAQQTNQPGATEAPVVDNNNNQPSNNPCNLGELKSVLPKNGTEWLAACIDKTKFDIFNLQGFTTKEESQTISSTRECVDGLNIINTNGQKYLNCELSIGTDKKELGAYINAVLEGRAANSTTSEKSLDASGSNDIEVPDVTGSDATAEDKDSSKAGAASKKPSTPDASSSATSIALSATAIVAAIGAALQ